MSIPYLFSQSSFSSFLFLPTWPEGAVSSLNALALFKQLAFARKSSPFVCTRRLVSSKGASALRDSGTHFVSNQQAWLCVFVKCEGRKELATSNPGDFRRRAVIGPERWIASGTK
ncbi:hypothetical protein QQF64_005601, partial [Cirrhinus molitorella]